ncbi:disintegrin and metalloproteinase domain-containing protein 21-like [Eptesicus fuscus]|uniref:disintegrin and metalloproteinase domain-containing protein 21-like n=1 Tax=Eptesicus fuscus TaxID=29078 RepID=UPI00240480D7|nr:disintegrin and metalloproteinase domain-containing protein 21-like [Eptesicus fuscus]
MRLAEGPVTLRTPILLLGLWVVLGPAQCSEGHPSWRYISSEVVIPRKELHHGKAVLAAGWLSYSLRFGGQRHVLHMRRKRLFWPGQLVVMTQDDQGALQVDYPYFPLDCYYLGYLEDVPLSMVTVDTCYGGLEGIMKVDDLAYEIKPLKDSLRFEHIISQIVADTNAIGPMSTLGHKAERHPPFSDPNPSAASRISKRCLFREIEYSNSSLTPIRCGNSVVEDKEQCDCGTFKQCYTNPCCNSDCHFTPGSICNRETCCTNCTYTPAGTLCRPIQNICDLPEYCKGKDTRCPSDFYLQDGTPCTEDSYCYHGNCTDRSMHCKEIFGEGALNSPDVCYRINKKGHRFGHCKVNLDYEITPCADADVKCGRLQCVHVTHLPRLQEHVGFHHSILGGGSCVLGWVHTVRQKQLMLVL